MSHKFDSSVNIVASRDWPSLRERGFRVLFLGVFSLVIVFVIYARYSSPAFSDLSGILLTAASPKEQAMINLAGAVLATAAASMTAAGYGLYMIFKSELIRSENSDTLVSYILRIFSDRRYWKIMVTAAILYWIAFGFLTQILIYQPAISFAERGIPVPSLYLVLCCGTPGYFPMLTVYATDLFAILVIPLNVTLATIVSVMVGFNVAVSVYAFRIEMDSKKQGLVHKERNAARVSVGPDFEAPTTLGSNPKKNSVFGGVGAATGLFAGCPTCAGSFISLILGSGAGTTLALGGTGGLSLLASFQTLFILLSIPALVVAPFLAARSIRSISVCRAQNRVV